MTPPALPAVLPSAAPSVTARTAPLDPFPWGLPPGSIEIDLDAPILLGPALIGASAGAPDAASAAAAGPTSAAAPAPVLSGRKSEPDLEQTRVVGREPAGARFVLQFSTGESVSLSGTGILGRNPTPEPGEYFDSIVTIVDLGRSVSKTHLEFGQEAGSFWLSDRYSGNGTVVREPEQAPVRCEAGKRYFVLRGTRIDIGEQFFVVS
ncbi:MAG: FHA domain-containing protein [Salinibacterium sp.]|nr:FHA domain-containing protein [Salinibacterium sp.]